MADFAKYVVVTDGYNEGIYHPNDPYRLVATKLRRKGEVVDLDLENQLSADELGWAVKVGSRNAKDVSADVLSGKITFRAQGPDGVQVDPAPRFHQTAVSAALPENQVLDVPEEVGGPNVKPGPQASQS